MNIEIIQIIITEIKIFGQLEKSDNIGLLHDATTYFVKQINTIFIRVVPGDCDVYKVPFSMKEFGGSFTGEALYSELLEEMSKITAI